MSPGNTLAQTGENSDHIYRPLKRGERNPVHDITICFVGFCFSIPFAILVCTGLYLLLSKCYHSSCSGSSLPSFPSEPGKGRGEKGKQYYCFVRWIVALWSFTSRRGQSTPPSEASLPKHPLLSQEWLFLWWQLKLLHGCDITIFWPNRHTQIEMRSLLSQIVSNLAFSHSCAQAMGKGNSVPGLSADLQR